MIDQKQAELARSLARSFDQMVVEAMQRKGYPVEESYIKEHCVRISPYPGLNRFYHDGQLFLEIDTKWDNSNPMTVNVVQVPTLF
jgi:hypothetical protein